jgi:hypothetical protein
MCACAEYNLFICGDVLMHEANYLSMLAIFLQFYIRALNNNTKISSIIYFYFEMRYWPYPVIDDTN